MIKYYSRSIIVRESINRFGKLGYVKHTYLVKLISPKQLSTINYGLHVRFTETSEQSYIKILRHQPIGQIYDIKEG